jgi:hypothetical protein
MALGFEMQDVPHSIKHMMKGGIRRWYNKDQDDKKRKRSEQAPPCDRARGGAVKRRLDNGRGGSQVRELVEQQRQSGGRHRRADGRGSNRKKWDEEGTERKARDVRMHKRVERELEEIKRNPRVVSKKIEGAIQRMGVPPDRDVVEKLAAKVIAYTGAKWD